MKDSCRKNGALDALCRRLPPGEYRSAGCGRTRTAGVLLCLALALPAAMGVAAEQTTGSMFHDEAHREACGGDSHAHHKAMLQKPTEVEKSTKVDLKDLPLVDQDGRQVNFVSDVIGDKIVVMDFVYTSCTTVCPVLSALFGQVQEQLGNRLGNEVAMVSVSIDPIHDTPQRLKDYAVRHKARAGWVWLTGPKTTVEEVLNGLGAYSANFEDHPSMVLVGDPSSGKWSRYFGFPSPKRLVDQVNSLQAARVTATGG